MLVSCSLLFLYPKYGQTRIMFIVYARLRHRNGTLKKDEYEKCDDCSFFSHCFSYLHYLIVKMSFCEEFK